MAPLRAVGNFRHGCQNRAAEEEAAVFPGALLDLQGARRRPSGQRAPEVRCTALGSASEMFFFPWAPNTGP